MPAPATSLLTRRPSRGGGFTLIEMLAVIAMMAILMGVAVPALSSMGDTRGAMAGRHLLRDLTFARQHAIATGTITWMFFSTAGNTSWEIRAETGAAGKTNAIVIDDAATNAPFTQTLNSGSFADVKVVSASFVGTDTFDVPEVGFDWLGRPLTNDGVFLNAVGTVTVTGSHVVTVQQDTGYAEYVAP